MEIVIFILQDNVLLGSDYPFPLGEHHPGKLVETVFAEDEDVMVGFTKCNAVRYAILAAAMRNVQKIFSSFDESQRLTSVIPVLRYNQLSYQATTVTFFSSAIQTRSQQ